MTIYTDGPLVRRGVGMDEIDSGLGDYLGALAGDAFRTGPSQSLMRMVEMGAAEGDVPDVGPIAGPMLQAATPQSADVPIADAQARVKSEGLERHLKLPQQPVIPQAALDLMLTRARERQERESIISRGPSGFQAGALGVGTSLLVGLADPLNVASAFIPVVGEARVAGMLARAGEGFAARAGVRAGVGAIEGGAGAALLEPLTAGANLQEGSDYTMGEALRSVALGSVLGGGLHVAAGGVGDVLARHRAASVPSPAETVEALPPRAREDLLRMSLSSVIEGRQVDVWSPLMVAARLDDRIDGALRPRSVAEGVEQIARSIAGEDIDRAGRLTAQLEANRARLAEINSVSAGEEFSSVRRTMIDVEQIAARVERYQAAAEKASSPKERAARQAQADAAQRELEQASSGIDRERLDTLTRMEQEELARRDAVATLEKSLADVGPRVEQARASAREKYWQDVKTRAPADVRSSRDAAEGLERLRPYDDANLASYNAARATANFDPASQPFLFNRPEVLTASREAEAVRPASVADTADTAAEKEFALAQESYRDMVKNNAVLDEERAALDELLARTDEDLTAQTAALHEGALCLMRAGA